MTNNQILPGRTASAFIVLALLTIGCSESYRSAVGNPAPAVEAVLVVSDPSPPVGSSLVVSVRATATQGSVGSYTARIEYDPTALRYEGEIAMNDKGLRATNPAAGLIRFAGAAPAGFDGGALASYTFTALSPNSARSLSLVVDEMHLITRVDAKTTLTIAPVRITSR